MVNAFLNQKRKNDPLAGSQRQETTEEAFDNFSEAMVNMAINGINEAVARERKKTE